MNIDYALINVTVLKLESNDTLVLTIKSDTVDQACLDKFKEKMSYHFPNNKVLLVACSSEDDINFTVVKNKGDSNGKT